MASPRPNTSIALERCYTQRRHTRGLIRVLGPSFTFPPSSVLFLLEIPLGKEGRPQMGADTLGLATYRAHHSQATCLAPMA